METVQERKLHIIRQIEFDEVQIQLCEQNIIVMRYRNHCDVDVALVKKVNESIKTLIQDADYRSIVTAEPGVDFTKEGREYSVQADQISHKKAWAAVTTNLGHIIMVNFFMRINRPAIPFKMFKTEREALRWLQHFE